MNPQPFNHPEKRQIRIHDSIIHYQVAGQGAPLVLVHGLCASSQWWSRNLESLIRQHRVFCIDLKGFGMSKSRAPLRLKESSKFLKTWMAKMGLEKVHLMGHSMGGMIAAKFSAEFPETVRRLVLVAAAVPPFGHGYFRQALGMSLEVPRFPVSLVRVLVADAYRAGIKNVALAGYELFSSDATENLRKIKAPTLIVWGRKDTITPLKIAVKLRREITSSRLWVMKDAGHSPMWEKPAEFNCTVLQFLSK